MAGNAFAQVVRREYNRGLWDGWDAFAMVALVAGYNVSEDDDAYFEFFRKWEEECVRIFRDECREDPQAATEILIARTNELREKIGLEAI